MQPLLYCKNWINSSKKFSKHVIQLKRIEKYSIILVMALPRNSPIYSYQAPERGKTLDPIPEPPQGVVKLGFD